MSKIIFKNEEHQALFDKQGFLVTAFLNEDDLKELNDIFDEMHPAISHDAGFVSGSYSSDKAYKKRASEEIVRIFSKHYERLFINYQAFGAAFLYKMPNANSQLSIHQDWTIVDEEKFVALNCWVPLTDIDASNGALHVVPGTHYSKIKTLRAPTMPFFFFGNDEIVQEAAIPMFVKAGAAVILNQSVIHFSPPNKSNKIRKAITAGIKSKGAPMIFHYKSPSDSTSLLECFSMPEDFLIGFENFMNDISERPKMGSSFGFIEVNYKTYTKDEIGKKITELKIQAGYGSRPKEYPQSLFERLSKLFAA